MNDFKWSSPEFRSRFLIASATVKNLIEQLDQLEADTKTSIEEKLAKVRKIKEEILKIGKEIDFLKSGVIFTTHTLN